jgi:hypothetical protein
MPLPFINLGWLDNEALIKTVSAFGLDKFLFSRENQVKKIKICSRIDERNFLIFPLNIIASIILDLSSIVCEARKRCKVVPIKKIELPTSCLQVRIFKQNTDNNKIKAFDDFIC